MLHSIVMQPLAIAIDLAKQAGRYQLAHVGDVHNVEMKGLTDPVTEVDKACEQMIVDGIRAQFPEHTILAEEGGMGATSGEWQWIIDPLDGTVNYTHGYPLYCVCIALRHGTQTELGVIYEPNRDECFVAERGQGATLNERPIRVSKCTELINALLATGFAYGREQGELSINIPVFNDLLYRTRAIRRPGVAGADLAYVACGRLDGFWEFYLKPWDVAAGALLVEEAGGQVTMVDGLAFDPMGTSIVSSNGPIHAALLEAIQAKL